jgi:lipopolysaccharide export system permease protein
MKIIRRYIARDLLWTTLLALFVLASLFSFFTLVDQLQDTGRGNYGVLQAIFYVILTIPTLAYDLFPIAAVIGGMAALGMMARNNELDVIYTSGVSRLRMAMMMISAALPLLVLIILMGEVVAPFSEEKAQNLRSLSLTEQITLKTRYGFWIRDGDSYVNIRKVLSGDRIEQIYIYQFDAAGSLLSSILAESAVYKDGKWSMENIVESVISNDKVENRTMQRATWESLLNPEIINVVIVRPQHLTLPGLINYIEYLRQNLQDTRLYEQALWAKLVKPFSILAMIIVAVPLVRGAARTTAVGQRVFMGVLAGIIFHLANQVSVNLGVVYQIHPAISVLVPTILLYLLIISLLRN